MNQYGKVAVVYGGASPERAVSMDSGRAVLESLLRSGVDAVGIDGIPALMEARESQRFDRVFNIIHGTGGEDGQLQGVLAALNIPYTGSGILGSALSMDKAVTKELWLHRRLPTADFCMVRELETMDEVANRLGYPFVVKPVAAGSSVGVSIVRSADDHAAAWTAAASIDGQVMAEQFIGGGEYTVAIVGGQALPVVRIRPAREFYDYQAKYNDDSTAYDCPSGLSSAIESTLQERALAAFDALRMEGWGRIDFLMDSDGEFWLLEANTTPGMTSHSLVPKAAAQAGMDFDSLCLEILNTSFGRSSV